MNDPKVIELYLGMPANGGEERRLKCDWQTR
jgi:hypothetical protein